MQREAQCPVGSALVCPVTEGDSLSAQGEETLAVKGVTLLGACSKI